MKILSLIVVLIWLILLPSLSFGRGGYKEIYCRTSNINATDTVYYSIEATSPIWLYHYTNPYYLGTEFNGYSLLESDTFVVGNYPTGWDIGWSNLVGGGPPTVSPPLFSYGIYHVTVRKNYDGDEINFYLDFLDCDWPGSGGYPCGNDLYIYYSGDDSVYIDPGSLCDDVTVSQGETYTLWDLKGKTTAACKEAFELYLTVSTQNSHPYLTWNAYHERSGNNNVDYYEIWKKKDSGWFEKDTTSNTNYEDTREVTSPPGVKKYVYYKIRAIEFDEDTSLYGNTVKRLVWDPREEQKIFPFNENFITNNGDSPDKYKLRQNYPNPFNPVTNISFDLPEESSVQLQIYDIQGKLVSTLVNETMDKGNFSVSFNSDGLPSGVYFYRLSTKNFTDIKRMLLLK